MAKKKILKRKPVPPVPLEPNWEKPVQFEYTVALNSAAWRKVHPPHLEAALAAGEAAITASLEGVAPSPYSVAGVESRGTYVDVMWDSDDEIEDDEEE